MPTENENKYVLAKTFNAETLSGWERKKIEQGYIKAHCKIRREGDVFLFWYKHRPSKGNAPLNIEIPINERDYLALSIKKDYLRQGIRIRRSNHDYFLTYKVRIDEEDRLLEIEADINEPTYRILSTKCPEMLKKTRYVKMDGDEEWAADFLQHKDGHTYFVMAEVEMAEGVIQPNQIPAEIDGHIIHAVARNDNRFTNKKLLDSVYAARVYQDITANRRILS